MLKKLSTAMLVASLSLSAFAMQAFADPGHPEAFGFINQINDDSNEQLHFTLRKCDGDVHTFHFRETANRATWRTSLDGYFDRGDFVRVKADGHFVVAMQNIPGGNCDNLQLILDALDAADDESDDIEDILEVYEDADDLPEGHVLAPRPEVRSVVKDLRDERAELHDEMHELKSEMHDLKEEMHMADEEHREIMRNFRIRSKAELSDEMIQKLDNNLRKNLRRELREEFGEDRPVTRRALQELKERMAKRARLQNHDERVEELEERLGFEHVNPVRFERSRDTEVGPKEVKLRGMYHEKEGRHVLVNLRRQIIAELDVQGVDYTDFAGQKVVVKGLAERKEKKMVVDTMRLLSEVEGYENDAEAQFHVGASLYRDVDTSDRNVWYTQYLDHLFDEGVLTGYEDGSFGGANPVTIAEIAKIASESAGHDVNVRVGDAQLRDKYRRHWAKFYLKHAEDFNLLSDVENPDRPATRLEVLEAILRAYGIDPSEDGDLPDAFPDTKDEFIRKAYKLGIVSGFDDGTFRPNATTNRAEVAKMIKLAIEILGEIEQEDEVLDDLFEEIEDLSDEELEEWAEEEDEV